MSVKGNQGGLREDCEQWLHEALLSGEGDTFETTEHGHGREETRRYWSAPVPEHTVRALLWAGLKSVGRVEATRRVNGKTTTDERYVATSLEVNAERLGRAVREHWGIENGLHWRLDVAFREDESRTRLGHAAANMAVVRRLATTLVKTETGGKGGVQTRRMRAAWDEVYLAKVLQLE